MFYVRPRERQENTTGKTPAADFHLKRKKKVEDVGCTVAPQILIVLFLIYLFDNIIQLIFLRSLWYYGGW
jgi:hypothetical protein